jgi:hypothetical protein
MHLSFQRRGSINGSHIFAMALARGSAISGTGAQVTEISANDMAEAERIVEENWPGGGGMIVHSEHDHPHSALGVVYSKIPEAVKVAFGYLSAAYGAIAARYPGKRLVFTPTYVFLSHSPDEQTALQEFLAFKKPEEGGILVRASARARVPPFATQAHQSQQAVLPIAWVQPQSQEDA